MTVASTKADKKPRARLAPEKWNELAGVVLLALALLAGLALASHRPADPSGLNRPAGANPPVANWIGPVGAEVSALGFGFFGLAALLVPVFLAVGGWRRLRFRSKERVTGRGLGVVVVLLSAPEKDFTGGEFVLTEQRPRMQSRAEVVPLGQGDSVVWAVRNRPVRGSRGTYRVNMRHGVSRLRSGQRHTLGLIFHDAT